MLLSLNPDFVTSTFAESNLSGSVFLKIATIFLSLFVNFSTSGTTNPIGAGTCTATLFAGIPYSVPDISPADILRFQGDVTTNTGRTFYVNFDSPGTLYQGSSTVFPWEFRGNGLSFYIPTTCRHWNIFNNSPFPIPWLALHGNGKSIIGGTINSFSQIGSSFYSGTQPLVRFATLQAAGTSTGYGGVITYALGSSTCPV